MTASTERSVGRAAGRLARQAVVGEQRRASEAMLHGHLLSLHTLTLATSVGVFIAHDGEPDLQPLVEQLWQRGQIVALPVLVDDPDDHSMRFVPWHPHEDLAAGRYAIPVPPDPERLSIEPDTLLVSLVAFDSKGGRMGRGGGFFDRYLAESASEIVGVGFEAQRMDSVPMQRHDVGLPVVVTDLGVRFNQRPVT